MHRSISNRQLILRITFIVLGISIVSGLLFSFYLKDIALHNLAGKDAKKTSEFIFEIMNVKMQEGWGKEDLEKIMQRLNHLHEGLQIRSYRSKKVEEILGVDPVAKKIRENDPAVRRAMQGEKVLIVGDDDSIRYLYPMRVKHECITCHYNTKEGDINGVLDITLPGSEISIPLHRMIFYFMIFLVFFLLLVFLIFYTVLNRKIVAPLTRFSNEMERIADTKDLKKRVVIESEIGEISRMGSVFNRLLDRIKFYYDKLISQFYVDALTTLPNRLALQRDIDAADSPSLILLNLDRFRSINNFYGYKVGDAILVAFGEYLQSLCHKNERLYRVGNDEFALLTEEVVDPIEIMELLEELNGYEFEYEGGAIALGVTCGVASGKERLIEHAAIALEYAKNHNKPLEIFHPSYERTEKFAENIEWTAKLKEALDENRIVTYFQPILAVQDTKARKFETLVRLKDRDGTIHPPGKFMEVAKLSRLHLRLTRTIARQAFDYFRDHPYEFSVNISIEDILDLPTRNYLLALLESFPEPDRVIFEILETEEITEFEQMDDFVKAVKGYGGKVAIDDFGSGYSNYSYIIKLKVDYLKIDSSLIKEVDRDEESAVIVASIVDSAHKLGIKTIAEFVHSESVLKKVTALGVDFVQGYYIDKPLSCVSEHTKKPDKSN